MMMMRYRTEVSNGIGSSEKKKHRQKDQKVPVHNILCRLAGCSWGAHKKV